MLRRLTTLALFAFTFCSAADALRAEGVEWHKDFAAAREIAKRTGKPMLIDFQADWCVPCQAMERSFWPRPEIVALSKKFVCVSLNFDLRGPELSRYQVDRIPAVVFTDSWGNFLASKIGFGNDALSVVPQTMQAIPEDFSALNDYYAVLERDRDNAAALVKVGHFYSATRLIDVSNSYFRRALKAKGLAADLKARESVLIAVGINHLKLKDYDEARKTFETSLKEFPEGAQGDTALLGIITAQLNKKKPAEAAKTFEQLKAGYSSSPAVRQAEQLLQQYAGMKN